ncbi:MAG: S8 family serine peptidase [Lachnospiraceae bacterium]|nr:S8 family serine peptidase [Lachnospiraceae bacterium]
MKFMKYEKNNGRKKFKKTVLSTILCSSLLLVSFTDMGYAKASTSDTVTRQDVEEFDYSEYDNDFVDNEIIVRFKNEISEVDVKEFFYDERIITVEDMYESVYSDVKDDEDSISRNVKQIQDEIGKTYIITFRNKKDDDLIDLVEELNSNVLIDYAEPNYVCSVEQTPNEYTNSSWYDHYNMDRIEADKAWDIASKNTVYVGVMDTGIDANHPDLKQNMALELGWNYNTETNENTMDEHSHGTHVAGIIGAKGNNSIGVAGVNWNVKLVPIKISGKSGTSDMNTMARGLLYAKSKNIPIVNLSFSKSYSQSFFDAVVEYGKSGGLLVTSAGNDGANNDNSTVFKKLEDMDNVIVVASSSKKTDNQLCNGNVNSNYGFNTVDVAAPGYAVWSTVPTSINSSGYAAKSGTSMATPHVAGAASLIKAAHPSYTPAMIKGCIEDSVTHEPALGSCVSSGGILNVYRAVKGTSEQKDGTMLVISPGRQETMNQAITRALGSSDSASRYTKLKVLGFYNFYDGTSVNDSANNKLKNLKYVDLSHYGGHLGNYAFANCNNLTDVTSGFNEFSDRCFYRCKSLKGIHSPGNLQTDKTMNIVDLSGITGQDIAYDYCFYRCESIKKVCLPNSNNLYLGTAAFWGCENLEKIYTYNLESQDGTSDLTNLSVVNKSLIRETAISSIELLNDIEVKAAAFMDCSNLKTVYYERDNAYEPVIGINVFKGVSPNCTVLVYYPVLHNPSFMLSDSLLYDDIHRVFVDAYPLS